MYLFPRDEIPALEVQLALLSCQEGYSLGMLGISNRSRIDGRPCIVGEEEVITNVRLMSEVRKKWYVPLPVVLA